MNEAATLRAVLDALIPPSPERGMPGAGALGLAEHLLDAVPQLAPVVDPALAELERVARDRGAADFASLSPEVRQQLLEGLSEHHPAFLAGVLFQVYQASYAHPDVLEALGMPPRPPHPLGYEVEADDLCLLEKVRGRGDLYRDV